MFKNSFWPAAVILILPSSLCAQAPIIDGIVDATYGSPISIQTLQTDFGDSTGDFVVNGAELNAMYARVHDERLYVMLTGNQEQNGRLEIFVDSIDGGENTISEIPEYGSDREGGWNSRNLAGLTFDDGFEADFHLFGYEFPYYVFTIIDRAGGTSPTVSGNQGVGNFDTGYISTNTAAPNTTSFLTERIPFAMDFSNAAGVTSGCDAADTTAAAAVTSGFEFSVALADIGNPSKIKIVAMQNNEHQNYLSNQMLPGLPAGQCNLGGDGMGGQIGDLSGVDLNQFAGTQYATIVVPEPTGFRLFLTAFSIGLTRSRRKYGQIRRLI